MNAMMQPDERLLRETYELLSFYSVGSGNADILARMLASCAAGQGAMPARLGLAPGSFERLINSYFPGLPSQRVERGAAPAVSGREDELRELHTLFMIHAPRFTEDGHWMATILATGCLADDHLWQDLGLWSRADLSAFIGHNFPALKAKNDRDMKWKKFFYKQLCQQEGIYTCRSPSCEVCADFAACFGPE